MRMTSRSRVVCCLVAILSLLLATAAQAGTNRTYTLFGSTERQIQGFATLGFFNAAGDITGPAAATGSLMIPGGVVKRTGTNFLFFPGAPQAAQLVQSFTSSQTDTHTFAVGGGPGDFEFCPPIGNPLNPSCNQAAGIAGSQGFTGFVDVDPGPNQFGGTFRIARKSSGIVAIRVATNPTIWSHQGAYGDGKRTALGGKGPRGARPVAAGGPTTFKSPNFGQVPTTTTFSATRADWGPGLPSASQYFQAARGIQTVGAVLDPVGGFIVTPGVILTTPNGEPVVGQLPNPSTTTGFPFSTGRARQLGINFNGDIAAYTVTGGNYRGPDGQGNIVLVAGGVSQSRTDSVGVYAVLKLGLVDTTLPEPTTGVALAVGLGLLLALAASRARR